MNKVIAYALLTAVVLVVGMHLVSVLADAITALAVGLGG